MKKLALILVFAAFSLSAKAQAPQKTQLTFDASAAYHPDNYFYDFLSNQGFSIRNSHDVLPIFNAELGIRDYIKKTSWFYETQIKYGYTQMNVDWTEMTFPDEIDPYYGFVLATTSQTQMPAEYRKQYHSAGLNLGLGRKWKNQKGNKAFALPMGITAHSVFARKTIRIDDNGDRTASKLYTDEAFSSWFYYGLYTKPSLEFSLSKKPTPWSFSIFASLNVLWNARDNWSTKFIGGGGLGVRYEL